MLEVRNSGSRRARDPPRGSATSAASSRRLERRAWREAGLGRLDFVQDNHSYSAARGVLRGLHYQLPPVAQDKLVRVSRGSSSTSRSTSAAARRPSAAGSGSPLGRALEPAAGARPASPTAS
jgi:hypothetical protein